MRRAVWIVVVVCTIAYTLFIVIQGFLHANAANVTIVHDDVSVGNHHLHGTILVPSSCDEITVRAQQVSTTTFTIMFDSWQHPSPVCLSQATPRDFNTSVFAPDKSVQFIATYNGSSYPIIVQTKSDS